MDGFGSRILQGSNKGSDGIFLFDYHFRKTVICEFDVAVIGDEQIFRFEFPVDDAFSMKKLKTDNNFGDKHANNFFFEEELFSFEIEVNIASGKVFHDYIYFVFVLKGLPNCDEKLVYTDFPDQLALKDIKFLNLPLVDYLHSILVVVFLIFC